MSSRIEPHPSNPNQIVVSSSRASAIFALVVVLAFFGMWYWNLFSDCSSLDDVMRKLSEQPILWLFAGFPLMFLPAVLALIARIAGGGSLVIDNVRAEISRGGERLVAFHDVESIEIRSSEAAADVHQLFLILRDGRELAIATAEDVDRLRVLAEPIARVSGAKIEYRQILRSRPRQ